MWFKNSLETPSGSPPKKNYSSIRQNMLASIHDVIHTYSSYSSIRLATTYICIKFNQMSISTTTCCYGSKPTRQLGSSIRDETLESNFNSILKQLWNYSWASIRFSLVTQAIWLCILNAIKIFCLTEKIWGVDINLSDTVSLRPCSAVGCWHETSKHDATTFLLCGVCWHDPPKHDATTSLLCRRVGGWHIPLKHPGH